MNKCQSVVNDKSSRDVIRNMINGTKDICGCKAKYYEDGEWYCGTHAPSQVKKREQKRYNDWVKKNYKKD